MPSVTYTGPFDGAVVDEPYTVFVKGEPVEVTDAAPFAHGPFTVAADPAPTAPAPAPAPTPDPAPADPAPAPEAPAPADTPQEG